MRSMWTIESLDPVTNPNTPVTWCHIAEGKEEEFVSQSHRYSSQKWLRASTLWNYYEEC